MINPSSCRGRGLRPSSNRLRKLIGFAAALLLFGAASSTFAQTWTFNGHTYKITPVAGSWDMAENDAVVEGGHLIAIGSQAEQDFVVNTILPAAGLTGRPVWTGLNDAANENVFVWSNGEPVRYTYWEPGAPDNYQGGEDYVTLNWHHAYSPGGYAKGTWNDTPLNGSTQFGGGSNGPYFGIIEIGDPEAPDYYTFGGHQYKRTSAQMSWQAAEAEAVAGGGHLIAIGSAAEQAFVVATFLEGEQLKNHPVWIGMTDEVNEGIFKWSNGEPLVYANWVPGAPDNHGGNEDYAALNWHRAYGGAGWAAGTWNDTPLNGSTGFGGNSNGPYYGIIEIGAPQAGNPSTTTWTGGSGNWSDATKWSAGVPNSPSADAIIDDQPGINSVLNINTNAMVGRLRIDSGDTATIAANVPSFEVVDTAFLNAGELLLNGTFQVPGATSFNGPKTLNGTGKFVLGSSPSLRPEITGVTFNNATIEGAAQFGRYNNGSYPGRLINTGTVNANLAGAAITFDAAWGSSNTGTIKATNGGVLHFNQGTIENSGPNAQIIADGPNAIAQFGGFSVAGGTLSSANGGLLKFGGAALKNLTIEGSALGVGTFSAEGTLTTNGTLTLPGGSRLEIVNGGSAVTLNGTGEIVLNGAIDGAPELIDQGNSDLPFVQYTFDDVKVRGAGNVGYIHSNGRIDNVSVINQGTFQADKSGEMMLIDLANFDNRNGGFLRAIDGGTLRLAINGPLRNTGGTIEALDGGRIEAAFARIEGGVIRNLGGFIPLSGMTIVNPTSADAPAAGAIVDFAGMKLEGDLTLGAPGSNQAAGLIGDIQNSGTLRIAASGGNYSYMRLGEYASGRRHVTLRGGGEVILGTFADGTIGNDNARMFESLDSGPNGEHWAHVNRPLNNIDNTIRGFGGLGWDPNDYGDFMRLINGGTIMADVPGKTLSVRLQSGVNNGTFRSLNGGTMVLRAGSFDNTNGLLESVNGSPFKFSNGTITGGTVQNNGAAAAALNFDLANATFVNLTLRGPLIVRDATRTGMIGTIQNEGSVRLRSSTDSVRTRLAVGSGAINSLTLNGSGELLLGDPAQGGGGASVEAADGTSNPTLTLNQNMRGFGVMGFNSSTDRGMHLVNNAEVIADVSGKALALVPHSIVNSPNKSLKATNGGTLYLHPVQLTNTTATIAAETASRVVFDTQTVITGGIVGAMAGGTIEIYHNLAANGGALFANAGTMLVGSQANGGVREFNSVANGGATLLNTGVIKKTAAGDYRINVPMTDSGAVSSEGSGIIRFYAGAQIADATFAATIPAAEISFERGTPYSFSGLNTFTGPGKHWFGDTTVQLADAATTLNMSSLHVWNTALTGPGAVNVSSNSRFFPGVTFSGPQLTTTGTHDLDNTVFQNGTRWENSGSAFVWSTLNGTADTKLVNTETGVLTGEGGNEGILNMPYENRGTFASRNRRLHVRKAGTFKSGKVQPGAGWPVFFEGVTTQFEGTNTVTGLGTMESFGVTMNFAEGAKLNVENGVPGAGFGLHDGTKVNGGEINLSKDFGFHNYTGTPMEFTATAMNTMATATGRIRQFTGTTRFNNAHLKNGGTFEIQQSPTIELNGGSTWENSGKLKIYDNPTFGGDGTGKWNILPTGLASFYSGASRDIPYETTIGGGVETQGPDFSGIRFTKGGRFGETAKVLARSLTTVQFAGSNGWTTRGNAVEMNGTGSVQFADTKLTFEPTTENPNPDIDAGAAVNLLGANTFQGPGTLRTTQFYFQQGSTVVAGSTLETTSGNFLSEWNNDGGKLELKNGARFLNGGRLAIKAKVGQLLNQPGITGDSGTLFHNLSTGRIIHDSNSTTEFGVDFINEGFLEFSKGTTKFLKKFSGRGGIAASNGAKVDLSLVGVPESQQPQAFELSGNGSSINLQLAAGQTLAASINLNGGQMVAAGGLNMVAAGGLNLVAAGGGNMVAAGGMNMVAAGGGNITVTGTNSLMQMNNMVAAGAGNILSHNGGTMVAAGGLNAEGSVRADGGTIRTEGAAGMVAAGAGNILSHNGGTMVAAGAGNILSHNGGVMVAAGAGNMVAAGAGNMVAAGAGNMVAAGAGNMVAAGAGNMVAAGGGNMVAAGAGNMVAAGGGNIVAAGGLNRAPASGGISQATFEGQSGTALTQSRSLDEVIGIAGLDELMARVNALNTDPNVGVVYVDVGGTAKAQNGGSIIAEANGIIAGGGTFDGPGLIKSGGAMMPGSSAGTLTWTGNLTFESGSLLDIEIGGTTAGTQYDVVNVSGTLTMNGVLNVRLLNGFASTIQPTDTFDIAIAAGGITSALSGTRVSVAGTRGSFAIQLVNDGKTLRLTDYQLAAPTFSSWASQNGLSGAAAAMTADPDGDGLANLLEYALGKDPNSSNGSGTSVGTVETGGQKFLSLSYTKPTGQDTPSDLTYSVERATALAPANWSSSSVDLVTHAITTGPGTLETITVRSTHPIGEGPREFLHLRVTSTAQ
jgi:hypothetical protein